MRRMIRWKWDNRDRRYWTTNKSGRHHDTFSWQRYLSGWDFDRWQSMVTFVCDSWNGVRCSCSHSCNILFTISSLAFSVLQFALFLFLHPYHPVPVPVPALFNYFRPISPLGHMVAFILTLIISQWYKSLGSHSLKKISTSTSTRSSLSQPESKNHANIPKADPLHQTKASHMSLSCSYLYCHSRLLPARYILSYVSPSSSVLSHTL